MKIINTSLFEKLKIRPVDIKEMHFNQIKKVNANTIEYSDLKVGYIVETKENKEKNNAFYMLVDIDTFVKLFDNNHIYFKGNKMMLVQPMPNFSEPDNLTYLNGIGYEKTFPCYDVNSKFDIKNVYMLDCNLSDVETKGDFIKIYDEYMRYIKEL